MATPQAGIQSPLDYSYSQENHTAPTSPLTYGLIHAESQSTASAQSTVNMPDKAGSPRQTILPAEMPKVMSQTVPLPRQRQWRFEPARPAASLKHSSSHVENRNLGHSTSKQWRPHPGKC